MRGSQELNYFPIFQYKENKVKVGKSDTWKENTRFT